MNILLNKVKSEPIHTRLFRRNLIEFLANFWSFGHWFSRNRSRFVLLYYTSTKDTPTQHICGKSKIIRRLSSIVPRCNPYKIRIWWSTSRCDVTANQKKKKMATFNRKFTDFIIRKFGKKTSYLFCWVWRDRLALRWSDRSGSPLREIEVLLT